MFPIFLSSFLCSSHRPIADVVSLRAHSGHAPVEIVELLHLKMLSYLFSDVPGLRGGPVVPTGPAPLWDVGHPGGFLGHGPDQRSINVTVKIHTLS